MFSKGQIVNFSNVTYRVGDFTLGSVYTSSCNGDTRIATAKLYHPVENTFPYNDIQDKNAVIIDDDSFDSSYNKGYLVFVFPQDDSKEFIELIKNQISISKELRSRLSKEWVKIGSKEYKMSVAFGGERVNIIYREPEETGPLYNILFADDIDIFI